MESIIEELWYGNNAPLENDFSNTPELKEILRKSIECRKELEQSLSDAQKELLNQLFDCRTELDSHCEKAVFSYGFRLGIKIIMEAMSSAEFA